MAKRGEKINRRTFLKLAVGGGLGLSISATGCAPFFSKVMGLSSRPNILFIIVDNLNTRLGCYESTLSAATPHIDLLAENGLRFSNAQTVSPISNPSRIGIFAGLPPDMTGIYENEILFRDVLPTVETIPQFFQAMRYDVYGSGRVFYKPDKIAWPEFFGQKADPRPPNRPLNGIPDANNFDWGPIQAAESELSDYKVVDWAIEKMKSHRGTPFFMGVGLTSTRIPWYLPPSWFERYENLDVRKFLDFSETIDHLPPYGQKLARPYAEHAKLVEYGLLEEAVKAYFAAVSFVDFQIGRLLEALSDSGKAADTVVILCSDGGWHLGEKKHWRENTLWEPATKVPLIISAPGITEAGGVCSRSVSLLDLFPTLIDVLDSKAAEPLPGTSLLPWLRRPDEEKETPAVSILYPGSYAVRTERWHYIRYPDGSAELYDHSVDPEELENLAALPEHGDRITSFNKIILARISKATPVYESE